MSLSSKNLLLIFLVSFSLLIPTHASDPPKGSSNSFIGITYSQHLTSDPPSPDQVVSTLRSLGVAHLRVLDPDPDVIHAFSYTDISLLLSIPNTFIQAIAANQTEAIQWLYRHVVPFYPRAKITTISVGNDVLSSSPELSISLVQAIRNVNLALHKLGILKISVSTTHSFDIIASPFPPSAAKFQKPAADWIMKQLLDEISTTNSPFLINAYPYKLYRSYPEIPLGYALFQKDPFNFCRDPTTSLQYWNLFDVMVDAVINAMEAAGHKGIPVVVTETGWPSNGGVNELDATEQFAGMYNMGLVRHLLSGHGTPRRKEGAKETYIFELFDENMKQGPRSDRNWGILNRNMTKKYGIHFSGSDQYCRAHLVQIVVSFCLMFGFLL